MTGKKEITPFLGTAYYPEAWDASMVDEDLDKMCAYGIKCVRIAEFAWKNMEPEEGKFDFSLMRKVVDGCKKRGMYVIMGTPAACPPVWLSKKCPGVYAEYFDGKSGHHGARRLTCFSDPDYIYYGDRITEMMAREFGKDENVIGWQVDNEIDSKPHEVGCVCPKCTVKFRSWVRDRFDGDVEKFNKEVCTGVFSMRIEDFSELDHPFDQWSHPGIRALWLQFKQDDAIEYVARQRDIIRRYSDAPVGTDLMITYTALSYSKVAAVTDVMQVNEYFYKNYSDIYGWYNYAYNCKNAPFWLTETSCCWNGATESAFMRPHGFVEMNGWSAIVSGAENVNYWLWRAHYGAHELMHGSVVESSGRDRHVKEEIERFSRQIAQNADFIKNTRPVKSGFSVMFSADANIEFIVESMYKIDGKTFDYHRCTDSEIAAPLLLSRLSPAYIPENADFTDAKVLFTPFIPDLQSDGLAERLLEWTKNGGMWIAGPLTDIRTASHAKFVHGQTGVLEKAADIEISFTLPAYDQTAPGYREIKMNVAGAEYGAHQMCFDAITPGRTASVVATYAGEPYLDGYASVTRTPYGKGEIVVVGCLPARDTLISLMRLLCAEKGIKPFAVASENVMAVEREGSYGRVFAFIEYRCREGAFTVPFDGEDLLSGVKYTAGEEAAVSPYQVVLLKETK